MADPSSHGMSDSSRSTTTPTPGRSITSRPRTGRSRLRTTTTTSSDLHQNEIICAVSEGRGIAPTIGLSFVNLSTSEAVLCQFSDTQTYARICHKIRVFEPTEILIAETTMDSKLVSILKENLYDKQGKPEFTPVSRRFWSDASGYDYLQQLAFPDELEVLKLSLAGQYFAMCCFAAVLRHIDLNIGRMFAPQTLRIKFETSEGAMMIDTSTVVSLELVQNLQNAKSKDCLFGLLDQTLTRMGTRILKSNILQPSTDTVKITKRYEAVQELSSKEAMFFAVREALEGLVDTDRALAAVVLVERQIDLAYVESSVNNILMLKTFVDRIVPIFQALTGATSAELQEIRGLCDPENYTSVQELITYALNEDVYYSSQPADLRNQRVFAIKAGVNGFLDVARKSYQEINQDIEEMHKELADEHQLDFQLRYDPSRQYFLRMKLTDLDDRELPEVFVNTFRAKQWLEFQTLGLMKLNQRLKDAHTDIIGLSNSSIQHLIEAVRSKIQPLFKISEGIALLDMLASFSQLVTTQNYVQPELIKDTLAIRAGRHPIREKIQREKFIPNDVFATPQKRFQIITGCNMSGKSTYIRTVALLTVMAQIGCFLPAEYAGFPIITQLFARVSTDDSIEANVSTFASEMREMAFILGNIEPRSLVVVDELGRGTSTTDGLAIAIAISKALIESKAYVWFVTHFRDLSRILSERAGVVSLHLAVDIAPDLSRMKMMYKIAAGCEEQKFYGLAIARLMDLPQRVYDVATELSTYLNERNEARKCNAKTLAVAKRRKLVLTLREQLMQARDCGKGNSALRSYLLQLQEEFIIRMSAIDAEVAAAELASTEAATPEDDNLPASPAPAQPATGAHVDDPIEINSTSTGSTSSRATTPATSSQRVPMSQGSFHIKQEILSGREIMNDMVEDDEMEVEQD